MKVNKNELKMISTEFREYGSRLLSTNDEYGIDDAKRLLNYIDKTDILRDYIDKCSAYEVDIEKEVKNREFRQKYTLPLEKDEEVCFIYTLLKYGVEKFHSYWSFAGQSYSSGSNKIQDHIDNFNNEVTRHLINHIVRYLEKLSMEDTNYNVASDITKKKVFISYCWADKDIADMIDQAFQEVYGISFTRDVRDLKFKEGIKVFMESIGEHDFVIMIVSDNYLKSDNCMYEVMEVIRDRKFREKILFVMLNEEDERYYSKEALDNISKQEKKIACDVYSTKGRINYVKYWENKKIEVTELIDTIVNPVNQIGALKDLKKIDNIAINLDEFLETLSDLKNESLSDLCKNQYILFAKDMELI